MLGCVFILSRGRFILLPERAYEEIHTEILQESPRRRPECAADSHSALVEIKSKQPVQR